MRILLFRMKLISPPVPEDHSPRQKYFKLSSTITIIILDIIHRHVVLKTRRFGDWNLSCKKTGRWIMYRIVIVILIYHRHRPIESINLLGS
jgi:hypothetical protein